MGAEALVSERQTTIPAKKKGTAMTEQKIRKLQSVWTAKEISSGMANMIVREMGIEAAMANAACAMRSRTWSRSNSAGRSCTANAPAVIPNIAIETETNAR